MDNMFRALPRDLQWEVLAEFVGTHVVRNGKLLRKIVFADHMGITMRQKENDTYEEIKIANLDRSRRCIPWLTKNMESRPDFIRFSTDFPMIFCRDPITDDTIFMHRKIVDQIPLWKVNFREEDASLVLPVFEKNQYTSWPYTDKKLKR